MKELDLFEIISMTQNYVFEVAASKTNIIFKLKINKSQYSAHQTYTAEFKSVVDMEKVKEYWINKSTRKFSNQFRYNQCNNTLLSANFQEKENLKKIEKEKQVNEQNIEKKSVTQRNLQLRIKILEEGFQQLTNQFKKFNVLINQTVQPYVPSIYDRVSYNSFIQAPIMFQNQYDCPIQKQQYFRQEIKKQVVSVSFYMGQNQPRQQKLAQHKRQDNIIQSNISFISAKWINAQYITEKFLINNHNIIANQPTQIIGKIFNKQPIQFNITILQMSKKIKIGIVDMLYCSKYSVAETPNIYYFQSDGLYKIGQQIKASEHKGFAVMDNVKVRINFKACTIEWLIDSQIKLGLNIEKLKNKYIKWAPYIFLQSAKDQISIYQ